MSLLVGLGETTTMCSCGGGCLFVPSFIFSSFTYTHTHACIADWGGYRSQNVCMYIRMYDIYQTAITEGI